MDSIREQMDLTNEISDAISNPVGMGNDIDEVSAALLSRGTSSGPLTGPVSSRTSSRTSSRSWSRRSSTSASSAPTTCRCTRRHTCPLPGQAAWSRAGSRPSSRTTTTPSCVRCRPSWRCEVVQHAHLRALGCYARDQPNPCPTLSRAALASVPRISPLLARVQRSTRNATPSLAVSRDSPPLQRPTSRSTFTPTSGPLSLPPSLSPARSGLSRYVHHRPPSRSLSLSPPQRLFLANITPSRQPSRSECGRFPSDPCSHATASAAVHWENSAEGEREDDKSTLQDCRCGARIGQVHTDEWLGRAQARHHEGQGRGRGYRPQRYRGERGSRAAHRWDGAKPCASSPSSRSSPCRSACARRRRPAASCRRPGATGPGSPC